MKPKSLKEFVRIEYEGCADEFGSILLDDPLGDEKKRIHALYEEKEVVNDFKSHLLSWIDRYEQYLSSLIDPLTSSVFRIDSFLHKFRDFDESKQRRTYVLRNRETDTFLHSDGLEYGLTYNRDGEPTGWYETREQAEETLRKYWRNYKTI